MCDTPFYKKLEEPIVRGNYREDVIELPCGKCYKCLRKLQVQWLFRMQRELDIAERAWFVTYTLEDKHLWIQKNGNASLKKTDITDHFKLLKVNQERKGTLENNKNVKYFACGEYGTVTKRPHYHAIVYNSEQKIIEETWKKGNIKIGTVTDASISYVLNYVTKKNEKSKVRLDPNTGLFHRDYYAYKDIEPEFRVMSKGIGKNWLEKLTKVKVETKEGKEVMHIVNTKTGELYEKEEIEEVLLDDGKRIAIPRYYINKMFTEEERERRADRIAESIVEEKWKERERLEEKGKNPYLIETLKKQARNGRLQLQNRKVR